MTILKEIVLTALFSKTHFNEAVKTFQLLCFLRADLMLPPLVEKISSSFAELIETHRYAPMLACLVSVPRELVTFNLNYDQPLSMDVISILSSVLPGIDINDLNKFILTCQLIVNVLECIGLCDCSPALDYRSDITEYERDLCLQSAGFKDFVTLLLQRFFLEIKKLL